MSIKDDILSVLREFSPILAGFKLGLIVISYFGLGSVAKWIISYWYPFTRWVWDSFCGYLNIPSFPLVVKDSLTALVFFLPLGITALFQIRDGSRDESQGGHRMFGSIFGILFLFLICKDVLNSIASAMYTSSFVAKFQSDILSIFAIEQLLDATKILIPSYVILVISAILMYFYLGARVGRKRIRSIVNKSNRYFMILISTSMLISAVLFLILTIFEIANDAENWPFLLSIGILTLILGLMALAVIYAPRKLFLTTGAAVAFVLAAYLFELTTNLIGWIERAPTS